MQSRKSRSAVLFYTGVNTTITEDAFPLAFPQSAGEEGGTATSTSVSCSWDILLPLCHQQSNSSQLQGKLPLQTLLSALVLYPRL